MRITDPRQNLGKRISLLAVFFLVLMMLLIGRLVQKQIFQHDTYLAMAKSQQQFSKVDQAQRGKILIHDDLESPGSTVEVALDVQKYDLSVIPKNVTDKKATATTLADILGQSEADIFQKINNDKLYLPPLAKGIDGPTFDKINAKNLNGVILTPANSRLYPENQLLAQTLGFVNAAGAGTYGLENYYNNELKGYSGETTAEKDTLGNVIDLVGEQPAKNGDTILLTVDRSVQYYVEKTLEKAVTDYQADSGTVIIVEPSTGKIIAIANSPSYDPNQYNQITADKLSVFLNGALSAAWEPGSIMKPITMAGAIDLGKVTPDTTGDYGSSVTVDGYQIHTALNEAFGHETMTQVLENSDNVAMVDVSNKLGNQALYDNLKKFGLLDRTGVDISGESIGSVPKVKQWANVSRANISFGQGITVTPIQMVMAYAAIANGGKLVTPHIVDTITDSDNNVTTVGTKEVTQVVKPETASEVKDMLVSVVVNGLGKRAAVPGFKVAGKTGTAQVALPGGGGYDPNAHNGSFAGFAPADNPKFAMLVRLDNPKTVNFAESSAAPVFGQIANYLLNYYYKLPTTQ
jgi:cell division protein FtsI/penicillin-binding protein 2